MVRDAWELAHEAARAAGVELRPLPELGDADAIVRVMGATWPGHESFPREMLRALADSGNVPFGAFDGRMRSASSSDGSASIPRTVCTPTRTCWPPCPIAGTRGSGTRSSSRSAPQALEQGIAEVRWTFDPLVARNAYFNLHKLGAVADRFDRNHYGAMADEVNAGERSDRFTVRWGLEREPGPRDVVATERALASDDGWPGGVSAPSGRAALVAVPSDYPELRSADPACGGAWRDASAQAIEACLTAGMIAAGFDRATSSYLFALAEDVPG